MNKNQQIISIDPESTIIIRAHGNLDVLGWERPEVGIITDINVQKIRHEKKVLRLLFVEDCELSVPANMNLVVERVSGNARFRRQNGALTVNKIGGDAAFQRVNDLKLARVSENCVLENIGGQVRVDRIGGDLKGKNIQSDISVARVSGHVKLHLLASNVDIRSHGNIEVSLTEQSTGDIKLKASDNLRIYLPVNPNAMVDVKSGAENIELDVGEYHKKVTENRCQIILGDGARKVSLEAGDRVRVTGEVFDEQEIIKLFEDLNVLWEKLSAESEARRVKKSEEVPWEIKLVDGAAKIAEETMEGLGVLAGSIAEETIQQAEVHVKQALQQVEEQIRNLGYDVWIEEDEEEDQDSVVTAEEKLIVMKLLQEQKISVEEADRLLEVLEESAN